jgi:DNA-binding GntR family transcriptional regulator
MSEATAISRSVLADQVKDRLLQDILAGHYPPDSRIVETRVARELGVSQAPVREALRGLEATGVVEIEPFRGARVRRPTAHELLEAFTVRAEMESFGAGLAVDRITEQDLAGLSDLLEEMRRAARAGDRHALAIADAAFHAAVIGMARNATLTRVWQALEPFSRTYITLIVPGVDPSEIAELHAPILDALRRRDAVLVDQVLRRHFVDAAARLGRGWTDRAPVERTLGADATDPAPAPAS